jgi:hypothetical protein
MYPNDFYSICSKKKERSKRPGRGLSFCSAKVVPINHGWKKRTGLGSANIVVMSSLTVSNIASFIFVGALWGCTNPLLKYGSDKGAPRVPHPNRVYNFILEIVALLTNWKVLRGESRAFRLAVLVFVEVYIYIYIYYIYVCVCVCVCVSFFLLSLSLSLPLCVCVCVRVTQFLLPFLLNQLGSVAYVATLGSSAISLAQPICNSLAVLFNCITSRLLGEKPLNACM